MTSGGLRAVASAGLTVLLLGVPASAGGQAPMEAEAETKEAVERADRLLREGRAVAARRLLEEALEERPTSAAALEALGRVLTTDEPAALLGPAARAVRLSPGEPTLRRIWVRALFRAGLPDSARRVAGAWVEGSPEEPAAHLALAEALAAMGELEAAIAALQRGRGEVGEDPELARELSALFLRVGGWSSAAAEWMRLLGRGPAGVTAVVKALAGWPGDPEPALAALWQALTGSAGDASAPEAGVVLAFELDDPAAARAIVRAVGAETEARLARAHLAAARRRGAWGEAAWAAERLARGSPDGSERLEWRATAAEMALRTRDTASARRAFRALAAEAPAGSQAHRLAVRRLFSLRAAERGGAREAEAIYGEFLRRYPAPGPDAASMAADLALAHAREGRTEEARRVLAAAAPGAESGVGKEALERVRALLAFWAGRPGEAARRLRGAVGRGSADPDERTDWIRLLAALEAADSTVAAGVGRALGRLFRDPEALEAADVLEAVDGGPARAGRPALLGVAADAFVAAGRLEPAMALWRRLPEDHAGTSEAAIAMLELGRALLGEDPAAARTWLRRLVVEQPESAVSPLARRLLREVSEPSPEPS